jgi:hypothetical protein
LGQPSGGGYLDVRAQAGMCLTALLQLPDGIAKGLLQLKDPLFRMLDVFFGFMNGPDFVCMKVDLGSKNGCQEFFCLRNGEYAADELYFHV